jgi:hypothetical protein
MHFQVSVDFVEEGWSRILLQGTVRGGIRELFEGFGSIVRVIHDHRGGTLVSRADNDGGIRTNG